MRLSMAHHLQVWSPRCHLKPFVNRRLEKRESDHVAGSGVPPWGLTKLPIGAISQSSGGSVSSSPPNTKHSSNTYCSLRAAWGRDASSPLKVPAGRVDPAGSGQSKEADGTLREGRPCLTFRLLSWRTPCRRHAAPCR